MKGSSRGELVSEIGSLLHEMGRRVRTLMARRFAEVGLSPPMVGVIHLLEEPLPMSTLAERMSCDASYMTGLADRLEDRGLLERLPDPSDRRVRQLVLTDRGRAMRTQLEAGMGDSHPILDRLDERDLETFRELLRKALDL